MNDVPLFQRVTLIGIGLIGSSLARVMREQNLAGEIVVTTRREETLNRAIDLGLCDRGTLDMGDAVSGADLVIVCTPMGSYAAVGKAIAKHLKPGAIISDVGSVKEPVFETLGKALPDTVHLVPGHPIAGTEHSGPDAGFATLFKNRWTLLTPAKGTDQAAVDKVIDLWQRAGAMVEVMDAHHHDQVLAITSHLPHLIAYTIVGTATDLGDDLKQEVIQFSASGFRDFTRIAASDPTMWRDIFLTNKDAVLEVLGRFDEDLTELKRAIRKGDGEKLFEHFTRTRAIRRGIIDADQA
ncbi:MAG: prephenate/arogenate dehydrogenase family protein [Rhodospirillales bacterium]|nr:prephenate/arogenate dehydrogenase family protein [Rhodospirillales bacterium]